MSKGLCRCLDMYLGEAVGCEPPWQVLLLRCVMRLDGTELAEVSQEHCGHPGLGQSDHQIGERAATLSSRPRARTRQLRRL
jgi:hypothetical protein